ncbi:MAG: signal recognition particle protein [Phycisphaeraceae bacterium]|nr:signal recognition particle protein [Phycisphaeraceae bacterium]
MFESLSDRFSNVFRRITGQGRISESNVRDALAEVRDALIEADVHHQVVEDFTKRVLDKSLGADVLQSVKPGQQIVKLVYDELVNLMAGEDVDPDALADTLDQDPVMLVEPGPTVVMMCGLQGSGKTTTCGKLAAILKKRNRSVMLAAGDLQRPAAVLQLQTLAEQVQSQFPGGGRVVFHGEPDKVAEYGKAVGAAVGVARNALNEARKQKIDVLILDTAGRLHVNAELMAELRQVASAVTPHQILLVVDAMTGQDAVNSAKAFNDQFELDGVVLTKFDSDTRGGAALSVKHITGKPIRFIGVGEKLDALEMFHPQRIASRILGMGDVVSLVEKAQEQVSLEEAAALQEKMARGQLTMDDFLQQLRSIRKMGPLKSLLGMLPGVGSQIKNLDLDDKQLDRTEAIIRSMTPQERQDVSILDNSRRRRIARGSGTQQQDVSQLVKGFEAVAQLTKQMSGVGAMGKLKAMTGMSKPDLAAMGITRNSPGMNLPANDKPKRLFKERKRKSR